MASVILTLDGEIVQEHHLSQARTTIGRRPYHDIVIDNLAVSGDHAIIIRTPDGWVIEDCGSTNGTLYQGEPITRRVLKDGDLFQIGRYKLRFVAGPATPAMKQLEKTLVMRSPFAGKTLAQLKGEAPSADAPTETFPTTLAPELSPRAHGGVVTVTGREAAAHPAVLKVLSGPQAGQKIPLDKPLLSLGKPGVAVALITRKASGYFLAHVDGKRRPLVNGHAINDKPCPLNHHDLIELGPIKMQFCLLY
ncbi:FHA domain-containing protein [Thiobacter aerophilum]|uniref:FHA domain-containing protein n=1 Tax=Thiobacter aerophilum TaxID=3121275 RepID=A0ABV0EC41_9BURK